MADERLWVAQGPDASVWQITQEGAANQLGAMQFLYTSEGQVLVLKPQYHDGVLYTETLNTRRDPDGTLDGAYDKLGNPDQATVYGFRYLFRGGRAELFSGESRTTGNIVDRYDGLLWMGTGEHDTHRGAPLDADFRSYANAVPGEASLEGHDQTTAVSTLYPLDGTGGQWNNPTFTYGWWGDFALELASQWSWTTYLNDPLDLNGTRATIARLEANRAYDPMMEGYHSDDVGLGEGLIPVWGSGKQAYIDYGRGDYWLAASKAWLAGTEAVGIGYAAKAAYAAHTAAKTAARAAAYKAATRARVLANLVESASARDASKFEGFLKAEAKVLERTGLPKSYHLSEFDGRRMYRGVNSFNPLAIARDIKNERATISGHIITKMINNGATNVDFMRAGYAPIGRDGFQINLHHILGAEPGPMVELLETTHRRFSRQLHGLIEK